MVHQRRSESATYSLVAFLAPRALTVDHNIANQALDLDIPTVCNVVFAAVEQWLTANVANATVHTNANKTSPLALRRLPRT